MALTWHTFPAEARHRQRVTTESNWFSAQSSLIKTCADEHGRTRPVYAPCSFVRYTRSACRYSGSHAKMRAGSPWICSQLSTGGQRLGWVNVQRQLKVTL